ncbi:hypothetical protein TNCV_3440571 [Trichonephila clavipes]|uniref:Uncharacterized protein n=1 Tax=Trichonephila clavipes TaxID=2585209 RepID=A0A8X6W5Y0_TRICX|nr:hypothetical protein TNCV_3440571 [Trichonephila clavipes]
MTTQWLLETDLIILNLSQVTRTTPELSLPLLTTKPHPREDIETRASARSARWIFSGTMTRTCDILAMSSTATAGSDVVQSGRPIFDDFFQHLWPYIGNNTANVVFQMVKRLWLIRIDQ